MFLKPALLIKIVVTLLVVSGVTYLGRVGIADFMRLAPTAYVDSVMKGEVRPLPMDLVNAREQLLRAGSWDESNPLIPEYLGQVAFMHAQLLAFSPALQAIFLREAVEDFQVAIRLRPNSSVLWADRMTAGSWLLQINEKLGRDNYKQTELAVIQTAIRRAAVLGPWEPQILKQLVKVGTLRYAELSPDVRLVVDGAKLRARQLQL
jgi:hypothetical protein